MKQRQSGSAHVIIIVILVLGLIGALGWIFYQNFVQKGAAEKVSNYKECIAAPGSLLQESYPEVCVTKDNQHFVNPDQKAQTDNQSTVKTDPNEGYLVLKDWGVRFKPSGATEVKYTKTSYGYRFTTDTWEKLGGSCAQYGAVYLKRQVKKDTSQASPLIPLDNEQKIGDYYYYASEPGIVCSNDSASVERDQIKTVEALLSTIEAAK